jgi:hypothetical protein
MQASRASSVGFAQAQVVSSQAKIWIYTRRPRLFQNTSQCEGDSAGSTIKGLLVLSLSRGCLFGLNYLLFRKMIGALSKWLALLASRFVVFFRIDVACGSG